MLIDNISKSFKPNMFLTNMSLAAYAEISDHVATKLFPIVPVQLKTSTYFTFDQGDIARDNVQPKPTFGRVQPAIFGQSNDLYNCTIDQLLIGMDQLEQVNYSRAGVPGLADPRKAKVKNATEQMLQHLDALFAQKYFNATAWSKTLTGKSSVTDAATEVLKFSDANCDPIKVIDTLATKMKQTGRRRPNKLALGANTFDVLKWHPDIIERVKYTGSTANPALVNTNVLAQLFQVEEVVVLEATYNAARVGEAIDMKFTCDPNGALLLYSTNTPQIDEVTAGYTFIWDMGLGGGNFAYFDQWEGEKGTHAEFIEGLCARDLKKTSDTLGVYLADMV